MDNDLEKFIKCDIFTPNEISNLMASKLKDHGTILEPSVGTGELLRNIDMSKYEKIDAYEIKKSYLDNIVNKKVNCYHCDFLKEEICQKYDNIIMNPPYIRVQDLSLSYRKYLRDNFNQLTSGMVDIYYAFIIKCIEHLNDDGVMVAITPNSYLYNKSALKMRKYLFDNRFVKEIIDFKDKKVFPGTSVYVCITVFTKDEKDYINYNGEQIQYDDIVKSYTLFNQIQSDRTLKDICKITNGIATLRDKVFIHETKLFDEPCWVKITNGNSDKYAIYPYENGKIIPESLFENRNPHTYEYLCNSKEELEKRDKGNKKYPEWYAYGRSQSIKYSENKCIYIPCFINPEQISNKLHVKSGSLHIGCLCINPIEEKYIDIIINSIIKNIKFIQENSSKRSGGWINLSSRILYQVPVED